MTAELDRIAAEFERRTLRRDDRYSVLNPAHLYIVQNRERRMLRLISRSGFRDLSHVRLLDVGCGGGGELCRWVNYGVPPDQCYGVELVESRVQHAREVCPPAVSIELGDASELPYEDESFDLVMQSTVFTSILDADLKRRIARQMLRVVKPSGMIIWYDFWWNPNNPQTRGIRLPEIKSLFPNCRYDAERVTLAPPIARRLVPISATLARVCELLPLRTHWLVGIRPRDASHHATEQR